jgi:hypothetical protein
MEFTRKVTLQAHDRFQSKADIAEVVQFVREQRVPGQIVISLPGNGGVTSVEFVGKPQVHEGEIESKEDTV